MDTVHFFVQIQLIVTVFLVALLWSLHNRLHRQEFFRFWAWAWTFFGVFLGLAVLSQYVPPQMLSIKELVVLVAVEAGFLQIPLLVFGAWSLETRKIGSKRTLRLGVGLALAAGAASLVVSRMTSASALEGFCIRSAPRTLVLAVALLFCAWVFFREWRANRSWAAAITGGGCALYAVDQGLYSAAFINYLAFRQRATAFADVAMLLQPRWLFLDIIYTCGICLGLVLLLLEEHQRTETALLKSRGTAEVTANTNVALQAEIAERKRVEEALRRSEEQYRRVVDHLHDALMVDDTAGHVVFTNDRFLQLFGLDREKLQTLNLEDYVAPEWRLELRDRHSRRIRGESVPECFEYEGVRRDGQRLWLEVNVVPIRDSTGKVTHTQSAIRDITDRKRAEEALRESEDRYRDLVEHSQDLICTHDLAGKLLSCNPAAARILGYNVAELLAIPMRDIIGPEYREEFDEYLARMKTVGTDKGLMAVITRTGERRIWDYDNTLRVEGVPYPIVRGMAHDITERTQAERELRASEDKLRLLLDSTAEAIYGIDLEHRCTFCNPACLRALGYEGVDGLLGKKMHDLIHHTRTDGTLFPVDECRVHGVIRTGEGDHAEDEAFWRANGTSFPVEYWSYPQRKGHKVVGAVVAFIDITQRKLAEAALSSVSRRLIEAQEQERTRIARELHDDVVQRLALLAIELEQLQQTPPDSPANLSSCMGELSKQTSEIATDVQSLSHELHSSKLQYLGIAAAVRAFCKEFSEQQRVEIDCQTHDLPSPLPPEISLCLFRVLQEALHNSAKHSGVRYFVVRLWGTPAELHLTVMDSGTGFNRETAKTSRGLGLISMEERLKLVNGMLSVESQPGSGTTIHACVPLGSETGSMSAAG